MSSGTGATHGGASTVWPTVDGGCIKHHNYNLDMELGVRTLEHVQRLRSQITQAIAISSSAPIADLLSRVDLPHPYVVKALDVHPCLGKVAGRRLLDELGVSHRTRLGDLTDSQSGAITHRCGCARG